VEYRWGGHPFQTRARHYLHTYTIWQNKKLNSFDKIYPYKLGSRFKFQITGQYQKLNLWIKPNSFLKGEFNRIIPSNLVSSKFDASNSTFPINTDTEVLVLTWYSKNCVQKMAYQKNASCKMHTIPDLHIWTKINKVVLKMLRILSKKL